MQDHSDRRSYQRIPLLAYAVDKRCRLQLPGGPARASLVDISSGGARLRLAEPLALARGQQLAFSVEGLDDGGDLQGLGSTVRWQSSLDLGIQFDTPLGLSLRSLQDLVS